MGDCFIKAQTDWHLQRVNWCSVSANQSNNQCGSSEQNCDCLHVLFTEALIHNFSSPCLFLYASSQICVTHEERRSYIGTNFMTMLLYPRQMDIHSWIRTISWHYVFSGNAEWAQHFNDCVLLDDGWLILNLGII